MIKTGIIIFLVFVILVLVQQRAAVAPVKIVITPSPTQSVKENMFNKIMQPLSPTVSPTLAQPTQSIEYRINGNVMQGSNGTTCHQNSGRWLCN